jgi:hypothetical protein
LFCKVDFVLYARQSFVEFMDFIITTDVLLVLIVYSVDFVPDILSEHHITTGLSQMETEMYEFYSQDLKYLNNMLLLK